MTEPAWKRDRMWPGPNGCTWEIRRRTWPAHEPIRHDGGTYACVDDMEEYGLFCTSTDGEEQFLHSYLTSRPEALHHIWYKRLEDTALRQKEAPMLRRRPPVDSAVIVYGDIEATVDSHCIHCNEYGPEDGECRSRGDFSAFVVRYKAGTRAVFWPEQVELATPAQSEPAG